MAKRFLKRLGVLLLIGGLMPAATAWAQTPPEPPDQCDIARLGDAQDKYEFGFFDETIRLLQPCLSKSSAKEKQRVPALRLAALSYFEKDEPVSATEMIRNLLQAKRGYNAPAGDPQYFHDWIDELRPSRFFERRTFLMALGAAVIVGGVSYLIFKPSDTERPPLQGPPSLPSPPGGN